MGFWLFFPYTFHGRDTWIWFVPFSPSFSFFLRLWILLFPHLLSWLPRSSHPYRQAPLPPPLLLLLEWKPGLWRRDPLTRLPIYGLRLAPVCKWGCLLLLCKHSCQTEPKQHRPRNTCRVWDELVAGLELTEWFVFWKLLPGHAYN